MTGVDRSGETTAGIQARRILALPLYPLLVAAYFPLHLMADNFTLFQTTHLIRPLAVSVALGALGLALLSGLARDRHRAAFWAASGIVLVCFFTPIQEGFDSVTKALLGTEYSGRYLFVGLLALVGAAGFLIRFGRTFTSVANVVAGTMLLPPLLTLGHAAIILGQAHAAQETEMEQQRRALFGSARAVSRPNIFHIVLDGYSRQDVLKETYGFDNAAFIDRLRSLGFAVADEATTPYNQTFLVMGSVFSGQYVQSILPAHLQEGQVGRPVWKQRVRDDLFWRLQVNHVMRTLSDLGYRIAAADVNFDPVRMREVDRFFPADSFALTNFERAAYGQTVFARLLPVADDGGSAEFIRNSFDAAHLQALDAPFFLYLHIIAPHPPFDIDRHGNAVPVADPDSLADGDHYIEGKPEQRRAYRNGYLEKLRFVNAEVLSYVKQIMTTLPGPKVILIHGDHGGGLYYESDERAATCLKERFSPLLAVYASDGRLQRALPSDANLANLYRHVFNNVFDAEMPLLPKRSFFAPYSRPGRFEPVSPAQLRQACPPAFARDQSRAEGM